MTRFISDELVGRKIVEVRNMTEEEVDGESLHNCTAVLVLDDGTEIWPQSDDEGNGYGTLVAASGKDGSYAYVFVEGGSK